MNRTHGTSAASAVISARTNKNASKTVLVRLALGTTATAALLVAAAAPANAMNQDHAGAPGVVVATPSPPPSTGVVGGHDVTPAALGALGGISLVGAGLAVTLGA